MRSYINANLGANEKVIMKAKLNYLCIVPKAIGIILGIIAFFVINSAALGLLDYIGETTQDVAPAFVGDILTAIIALICGLVAILNISEIISLLNTELVITNKRVLGKVGVFSIKALDYPIEKVDNVSLNAGFFGKIFKYYTISVKSTGDFMGGIGINGIENAIEFKNQITLAIEQHSEESRKSQAEEIAKAMSRNQQY